MEIDKEKSETEREKKNIKEPRLHYATHTCGHGQLVGINTEHRGHGGVADGAAPHAHGILGT